MVGTLRNERGSALVTALFFIIGLTVTAAIIAMVATSEKRVTHNEYTHVRSFYSSDAGGEEAINWIRTSDPFAIYGAPGTQVNTVGSFKPLTTSGTTESNEYKYDIQSDGRSLAPGWSHEYNYLLCTIDSEGRSAQHSDTQIEVQTSRLVRIGY
jgi:Tfp pilus assembly protein PilX